ncbi:MAG TPA: hypothetical protein VEK73_04000 [Xanthobacteraceae bacterium]|nr:hypothetical protein [Xanthobacteraceae bacterium]
MGEVELAASDLMSAVNDFSSLLSSGSSILDIFGLGSSNSLSQADLAALQSMFDGLLAEVKQLFLDDLTDAAIATASGVAQSAHDFLKVDYANAQRAGESKAELWTLLTADSSAFHLPDLVAQASAMDIWATANPNRAQEATSLALMIYNLITAIRRERAANAPDAQTVQAEKNDITSYANLAVARVGKVVQNYQQQRLSAIGSPVRSQGSTIEPVGLRGGRTLYWWKYTVQDNWPASQPVGIVLTAEQDGSTDNHADPQLLSQVTAARSYYYNLCQGGTAAQMKTWSQALTSAVSTGYLGQNSANAKVIANQLPTLKAEGTWAANAASTLANLSKVASAQ